LQRVHDTPESRVSHSKVGPPAQRKLNGQRFLVRCRRVSRAGHPRWVTAGRPSGV
jgi:hypothetical protein